MTYSWRQHRQTKIYRYRRKTTLETSNNTTWRIWSKIGQKHGRRCLWTPSKILRETCWTSPKSQVMIDLKPLKWKNILAAAGQGGWAGKPAEWGCQGTWSPPLGRKRNCQEVTWIAETQIRRRGSLSGYWHRWWWHHLQYHQQEKW